MIVASLNGIHGFGFTEAIEQRDGSLRRMGRLEILLPAEARLQLRIAPNEEMTYSGPVWEDRAWRNESFAVVVEPLAFLADQLTIVSVSESDAVPAAAPASPLLNGDV